MLLHLYSSAFELHQIIANIPPQVNDAITLASSYSSKIVQYVLAFYHAILPFMVYGVAFQIIVKKS